MLTGDDFVPAAGGGGRLTPAGLRVFFRRYTARLHTTAFHPQAGRALSYQKIFEIQARQMRKVIEGEESSYRPFMTR